MFHHVNTSPVVAMRVCLAVLSVASSMAHAWCPSIGDSVAWRVESLGLFPRVKYFGGVPLSPSDNPPDAFAYADSTLYVFNRFTSTFQRHSLRTNMTSTVPVEYALKTFAVRGAHIVTFDGMSVRCHRALDLSVESVAQIRSGWVNANYQGDAYFDRQYLVLLSREHWPKVESVYDLRWKRMVVRTWTSVDQDGIYSCRSCDTSNVGYVLMKEENSRVRGQSRELILFENGPLMDWRGDSTCYYVWNKETGHLGQLRNFSYRFHVVAPGQTSFFFMGPRKAVFCRNVCDVENVVKTEFLTVTFE